MSTAAIPAAAAKPAASSAVTTVRQPPPAANDTATPFTDMLGDASQVANSDHGDARAVNEKGEKTDDRDEHDTAGDAAPPADNAGDWLATLRQSLALMPAPPADAQAPAATQETAASTATKSAKPAAAKPAATAELPDIATLIGDAAGSVEAATTSDDPLASTTDTGDALSFASLLTAPAHNTRTLTADLLPLPTAGAATGTTEANKHATDSSAASTSLPMSLSPDHLQFVDGLGERIVWITDGGLDHAQIELHPAELGALTVQIRINGDEAQIALSAEQPATRALLQSTMPQLRELMNAQGLQLMRAQIDTRVAPTRNADAGFDAQRDGTNTTRDGRGSQRRVSRLKLVDAYA